MNSENLILTSTLFACFGNISGEKKYFELCSNLRKQIPFWWSTSQINIPPRKKQNPDLQWYKKILTIRFRGSCSVSMKACKKHYPFHQLLVTGRLFLSLFQMFTYDLIDFNTGCFLVAPEVRKLWDVKKIINKIKKESCFE